VAGKGPFSSGVTDCVRKLIQKNVLKTLEKIAKPQDVGNQGSANKEGPSDDKKKDMWTELKSRIHKSLVEEMDLKKQDDNDPKAKIILREQTKKMVVELLGKEDTKAILATREDMNRIVKEILDEALGLGPLEDMLSDKSISEIMVVGPKKIYFEQKGKVRKSEVTFTNDRQVMNVIERIVAPIGRRIDEKTPYVDARLADGSRVHAIIPPCAIDGCVITIRKFPDKRLDYKDLVKFGSMTEGMADFLRISVEAHRNMVVSGGTGSGKTTLINMLGGFIQSNERIITCEDSAELNFPQDHVVRLETRPPSLEGDGEIDIRCLVKQTLRMRPDRIVVGECRGGETLDMLQAMNTGHDGSMTTVHSNTPRDAISRLETLVQYAGAGLPQKAIKEMIASAVHMIVQQSRLDDGSRKVLYITEIGGMQGEVVTLQDIFVFKQEGMGKDGKIIGKFMATGFIPKFIEKLEQKGYKIPRGLFTNQ
jgi:septum site-determining protein MinD